MYECVCVCVYSTRLYTQPSFHLLTPDTHLSIDITPTLPLPLPLAAA